MTTIQKWWPEPGEYLSEEWMIFGALPVLLDIYLKLRSLIVLSGLVEKRQF